MRPRILFIGIGAVLLVAGMCRLSWSAGPAADNDGRPLSAVFGPKETLGAWWTPPLPAVQDRMQAVHIALLPSGKVLIVNGSSNRNRIQNGEVVDGINPLDYAAVNNTSLFDPAAPASQSGLTRIASPPSPIDVAIPGTGTKSVPNDLFCSGHIQLPDGNVLFAGGTQNYYPGEGFLGSRTANLFDWKTETWKTAGVMRDGHWYPSLVALSDGRIMVISGLSWDHFSNSSWVEFYDPSAPSASAWKAVDIRTLPNSPFNTPLQVQNPLPMTGSHGMAKPSPGTMHSTMGGLDELDHYPRLAPLADGRLLITGDGSGGGNVDSTHTYLMKLAPPSDPGGPPAISFERGPERPTYRKTFGTAFMDPNATPGSYMLVGGLAGSGDINLGPADPPPDPRINVVGSAERYSPPSARYPVGRWSIDDHFLGNRPTDRRIMLVGLLLPTKQVLLIGGGTYGTSAPVFSPLLLTPDKRASMGYSVTTMNPGQQPRLYHTSSLLLPDGRVFLAGGNATRAARDAATGEVRLDTLRRPDGTYTFAEKGSNFISSEIYQIEIFYPPYLFVAGPRPAITQAPASLAYGSSAEIQVTDATPKASVVLIKLGSMTHAWDMGQRLAELKFSQARAAGATSVQIRAPENRSLYPPGYYMLFYVNGSGKPSKASIVRLG
jgi:hypothetical protein